MRFLHRLRCLQSPIAQRVKLCQLQCVKHVQSIELMFKVKPYSLTLYQMYAYLIVEFQHLKFTWARNYNASLELRKT